MLSKVPDSVLDRIHLGDEEIILNGPPGLLTGKVKLHNENKDTARVRYLDLKATKSKKTKSLDNVPLFVNSKLRADETRLEHVTLSLAPDTPPGTYEQMMTIGGKSRTLKIVVQPTIMVQLTPDSFTFQGTAPGTKHTATLTVTNLGNLPFQVPEIKHVAPLDMDLLCRAFGTGFRKNKDQGFTETMDHITRNIGENLSAWADATVDEAGTFIDPGNSLLANISVIMPGNSNADSDYELTVRFWDQNLDFVFKSHKDSQKASKK